jgi:hypothetical protein
MQSSSSSDSFFQTVILEGPPFVGKHSILNKAYKKLIDDYPLPENSSMDPEAPFLLRGRSPWGKFIAEKHAHFINPRSAELGRDSTIQLARSRQRKTLDMMGEILWLYSFKERKPMFVLGGGIGPLTFQGWTEYYTDCIRHKLENGYLELRDVALESMASFVEDHEEKRWFELGFQAVLYLPDEEAIKSHRKGLKREDISLEDTLFLGNQMEKYLLSRSDLAYNVKVARTEEEAVKLLCESVARGYKAAIDKMSAN